MLFHWLIIETILISCFKLSGTKQITDLNNYNKFSYNSQKNLEHKCLKEVPKIYLEYDRNYTMKSEEGNTTKNYHSQIEVCCDGYKRSKYDWNKCVPVCTNCEHGICLEPGNCECFPNYVKNHEGKCVLTCPVDCYNGRCKSDGTCKCNPGYKLDDSEKFCLPYCDISHNCDSIYYQYCSAPNTCSCIEGYQISRLRCEPICKYNCGINGTCESPNFCRCHSNSVLKDGICQAKCYQKCDNGLCVSPNRCICFEGYNYDQRTASCIPEKGLLRNIKIEVLG